MSVVLWIVTALLAFAFFASGLMKVITPREKLAGNPNMKWTEDFSQGTIQAIGLLEALGALGLVLPRLTGILPWLTPVAAAGLVLTMLGAAATHQRRHEPIVPNLVLAALAALVLVGRIAVA